MFLADIRWQYCSSKFKRKILSLTAKSPGCASWLVHSKADFISTVHRHNKVLQVCPGSTTFTWNKPCINNMCSCLLLSSLTQYDNSYPSPANTAQIGTHCRHSTLTAHTCLYHMYNTPYNICTEILHVINNCIPSIIVLYPLYIRWSIYLYRGIYSAQKAKYNRTPTIISEVP